MRTNKLTIRIKKPVREVFAFTVTPINTRLWVDSIVVEETNEWPVRVGSVYRNKNSSGEWSEYTVTAFKENKLFELTSKNENYHVRYTYRSISADETELEYYEWVDRGELEKPFTMDTLKVLKSRLERNN